MKSCFSCGSQQTSPLLQINDVPLVMTVPQPSQAEARRVPRGSVALRFCRSCGHVFNNDYQASALEDDRGDHTTLEYSPSFRRYSRDLAAKLVDRFSLRGRTIMEVGCNRGHFLKLLCDLGKNDGIGIDPNCHTECHSAPSGITIVREALETCEEPRDASFLCCRRVLEQLDRPAPFLRSLHNRVVSPPECQMFFEVRNGLLMLQETAAWDPHYQQCSYFTPTSLTQALARAGFAVELVQDSFGGQFLCGQARPVTPAGGAPHAIAKDDLEQVTTLAEDFQRLYRDKIQSWDERLTTLSAQGKRVVVWGAGSKGATFLNLLPASDVVQYAVDINPQKHCRFVPGSGHEIVSPGFLREFQPDCVIVMNSHYLAEIQSLGGELELQCEWLAA